MRNRLVIVFAVAVGFLAPHPLIAHHTGSTVLAEESITMKGVVQGWLWSNPHCLLTFEVTGEDGKVVRWVAETQAPNSIYSSGYRANSFKAGDEVTVTLQPAANGQPFGRLSGAVLPDGSRLGGQGGGRGRGATEQ